MLIAIQQQKNFQSRLRGCLKNSWFFFGNISMEKNFYAKLLKGKCFP